jgi:hypothetical protein
LKPVELMRNRKSQDDTQFLARESDISAVAKYLAPVSGWLLICLFSAVSGVFGAMAYAWFVGAHAVDNQAPGATSFIHMLVDGPAANWVSMLLGAFVLGAGSVHVWNSIRRGRQAELIRAEAAAVAEYGRKIAERYAQARSNSVSDGRTTPGE